MKNRKIKRTLLWILSLLLLFAAVLLLALELGPVIIGLILMILGIVGIIFLNITSAQYYNWPVIMVLLLLVGMFFKRQHWPLAGVLLTTGIFFLCLTSIINVFRIQVLAKKSPFLRWFGTISYIIISTYMFGWIIMVQRWPKEIGDIFGYTGIVLFVFSILGMVFTLPGSKFLSWTEVEKKIFFRSILIPLGIVFCLILITLVFSDAYFWLLDRAAPPLNLNNSIELLDLEGIQKI